MAAFAAAAAAPGLVCVSFQVREPRLWEPQKHIQPGNTEDGKGENGGRRGGEGG